jgi:UDP-glucose 4-epimerase
VRVLVSGANGLLGRELCEVLSRSHQVTGLVHSAIENPIPDVNYIATDLSRSIDISSLPKEIDAVFHLAQSAQFRDFPGGTRDTFQVNTSSTIDLLEYCRMAGGRQFFLASTGGVYGAQSSPISEAGLLTPPSEIGFYFASKLASEMFSSTYQQVFDVTVMRFFFMYGPRQRHDMFLPRIVNRVVNGEAISICPTGGIRVNPVLVEDVANLLKSLLGKKTPPILNIGGPDVVSIQQIAEQIGRIVSRQPIWEMGTKSSDFFADISIVKNFLGEKQLTPINEGLEILIKSMKLGS